ncbi:MAG: MBL fold metallo-hydrolase [Saccharolobus sp.]|jgi:glyoxylase-like metal-dependent hydrolase (beta-lactamase superfamily II)
MTFAKFKRNVYIIGGNLVDSSDTNAYLIYNEAYDYYILIDSTTGKNIQYVLESLLEIMKVKNKLKYVILTSCKIENCGGLYAIYNIFKPITIAHFPDSIMIRKGECDKKMYYAVPISLEINDKKYILDNLTIFLSKTVTNGSIIVKFEDILFSGSNTRISPYSKSVKYICNIKECKSSK